MKEIRVYNETPEKVKENEVVYDIDEGIAGVKEFLIKTNMHTKEYSKLTKKMDGLNQTKQKKELSKFAKEKLENSFKFIMKDYFKLGELDLPNEILLTYISGLFIVGNSHDKSIKPNVDKIIAHSLYEMSKRTMEANNG